MRRHACRLDFELGESRLEIADLLVRQRAQHADQPTLLGDARSLGDGFGEDRDRGGDEVALIDEIAAEHLAIQQAGLDVTHEAVALHGLPVGAVVGEDLLRERQGGHALRAPPASAVSQPSRFFHRRP